MTTQTSVRASPALRLRAVLPFAWAAVLLSGCSATGVLNTLQPTGGLTVIRDVPYGEGDRRSLDIYQPKPASRPAPVVVFFYGGNWDSGDKADYAFAGAALARRGYLTLVADYRVYPQVRWPDFLRDGAQAVRWAKDEASRYGGDPERLVLMGHSAGAYNAVELAVDDRWLAEVGLDPKTDVAAVVGLAGPYDFLPLESDELKLIFGPEAQRPDTQPITHVSPGAPPLWLGTGAKDQVVLPRNSIALADKVKDQGGEAELRIYKGLGHPMMVGALAAPLRGSAPVLRDVTAFIDAHTGRTAR